MKIFLSVFFAAALLFVIAAMLTGGAVFSSFWGITAVFALAAAALVTAFVKQSDRMDALEKELEELKKEIRGNSGD